MRMWTSPILVVLVGVSAAVALSAACTDDFDVAPAPDAGDDGAGEGERAQCPSDPPAIGVACTLPEGTTCSFGQCGTIVQCARGVWRSGTDPSAKPPCPDPAPSPGLTCPRCWPATATCIYGSTDCSLADASLTTTIASCPNGTWELGDAMPCRDGGGPDVQGDAEAGDD